MIRWMPWPAWAVVGLFADLLLAPHLEIGGIRPDFCVSILALSWLRRERGPDPVVSAWCIGLCRDLFSIGPLGLYALSFALLAMSADLLKRHWFTQHAVTRIAVVSVTVTAQIWLSAFLSFLSGGAPGFGSAILLGIGSGLMSAAVFVAVPGVIYRGIRWFRDGSSRLAWS